MRRLKFILLILILLVAVSGVILFRALQDRRFTTVDSEITPTKNEPLQPITLSEAKATKDIGPCASSSEQFDTNGHKTTTDRIFAGVQASRFISDLPPKTKQQTIFRGTHNSSFVGAKLSGSVIYLTEDLGAYNFEAMKIADNNKKEDWAITSFTRCSQ